MMLPEGMGPLVTDICKIADFTICFATSVIFQIDFIWLGQSN